MSSLHLWGSVPERFEARRIGEISTVQTGPFGSQLHSEDYVDFGTPIVTVEHLGENFFTHQNLPQVSDDDVERLSKYRLQAGDIVFSRVGSVDRRSLVREPEDGWLFSGRCLRIRPDPELVSSKYLSYFLGHPGVRDYIRSIAVGATMPSLNTKLLRDIPIYLPELKEQRKIGEILSSFDEKIECNRQTARALEELAQRLFKSWFVDFDPVRAKMAGRQPVHMPPETAALFPEKLVDSPLGPIPEGWEFQSLDDLAEFVNGKNFTKNATGGGRMVMRIAELNSGPGGRTVWNDVETDEKHIANPGDIVFAWSGSLGVYRWYRNPALINQHIFKVIPKTGVSKAFSYQAVLGLIEEFRQIAAAKAVTMGHIKRSDLKDNGLYLPSSQDLIGAYSEIASPMWDRALMLEQESETLAALRDRLLPKLISGEIRVPEAQESAEEA